MNATSCFDFKSGRLDTVRTFFRCRRRLEPVVCRDNHSRLTLVGYRNSGVRAGCSGLRFAPVATRLTSFPSLTRKALPLQSLSRKGHGPLYATVKVRIRLLLFELPQAVASPRLLVSIVLKNSNPKRLHLDSPLAFSSAPIPKKRALGLEVNQALRGWPTPVGRSRLTASSGLPRCGHLLRANAHSTISTTSCFDSLIRSAGVVDIPGVMDLCDGFLCQ